jgi:hypothetical protein
MRSTASEDYKTAGDIHHWAEQWATDSLQVARAHVFNVELAEGCVIQSEKAPHDPLHVQSRIVTPASKKRYLRAIRMWPRFNSPKPPCASPIF